jgi:hypothetical protein
MPRDQRRRRRSRGRFSSLRPELSLSQVLAWADAHYERTGRWPQVQTGPVGEGPLGERWRNIDNALRYGLRGLPGGSSLAQLLTRYRGFRNTQELPPLSPGQILAWSQAHYLRTGAWPNDNSGPVRGEPGEVWRNVDAALRQGRRGLPGNSSLAQLLAEGLGIRTRANIPLLSVTAILPWVDAHYRRTGRWPTRRCGAILEAAGETWNAIDQALLKGGRGLPGGSSLAQLLVEHRGVRHRAPPLSIAHRHDPRHCHYPHSPAD